MATVIQGGDDTFNALALGEMHPGTQQFLSTQLQAPTHHLTEQGQRFFQSTQELFKRFEDSRAMRLITAAKRAVGGIWNADEIRYLSSIEDLQWAPSKMRRLIMAEPEIRRHYHQQRVEGYEGVYRDAYPSDVGESHYDYRRVTNGFVFVNEDENKPEWSSTTYYDDHEEYGDRELDLLEQVDVVDTWAAARERLRMGGDDPTSRFNAAL